MAQLPSPILQADMDIVDDKTTVIKAPGNGWNGVNTSTSDHPRVLRTLDWRILPLVSLLYLFSFIDRVNIGNAEVAGMSTDLNLTGLRYNTVAAIFFVPYCLAQVPSNILMKLCRPSRWLPAIMTAWGVIMTLMCLVNTYQGLLVARFFLGLAEAGFLAGSTYYISLWYPRAERAKRIAILVSTGIVGSSFAGLLVFAIMKMEGIGGLHGWQWIFCLEGLATTVIALMGFFFLPDDPAKTSILTATEKIYIAELLRKDSQGLATHYSFRFVLQALKDYRIYVQCIIYVGLMIPAYGIVLFTPTIINDLGFTAANAELLSSPPYFVGFIASVLSGIYSDKLKLRGPFVIGGSLVGLIGFVILYTQTTPGVAYLGNVFVVMGVAPCISIDLAWISSNAGGDIKLGVAIAMVNGFGNLGGICAAYIFFDPPRFHVGLTTIIVCLSLTILLSLFLMWDYNRLNKQKERMCREHGITEDQKEEFKDSGDDSPLFRYIL